MDLTRQQDLIDVNKLSETKVLLIGAGGIGSFAAFVLAKMGIGKMQVWDKDTVEAHNVPNQDFSDEQIDMPKVTALKENLRDRTGLLIDAVHDFWEGNLDYDPDIIITAVDSMDARIAIWEQLAPNAKKGVWLLDGRMAAGMRYIDKKGNEVEYLEDAKMWPEGSFLGGAGYLNLYTCKFGDDKSMKRYSDNSLYPSSEASRDPCTAKSIIYMPFIQAGLIGTAVFRIIYNLGVPSSFHGDLLNSHFTKESHMVT